LKLAVIAVIALSKIAIKEFRLPTLISRLSESSISPPLNRLLADHSRQLKKR